MCPIRIIRLPFICDVESFSTTEKEAIDKSYPRFASWAQSGGTTDKDWYLKK